jgi:hypothetical protein
MYSGGYRPAGLSRFRSCSRTTPPSRLSTVNITSWNGQKDRQSDNWEDAFIGMIGDLLADGKDAEVELPQPYAVIENEIKNRMDVLNEVVTPCLVDWDLLE